MQQQQFGAHISYRSLLAASLVGLHRQVFAFEADSSNFRRLHDHLVSFPWSTPVHRAVCSSSGRVVLERSSQPGESGWGALTVVRDLHLGDRFPLDAVSLDDWWRISEIASVSAVKIDAEGSECSILQGAAEFLARSRPAVIIEANDVV